MIRITSSIAIDESDIEERFIRSPGPGGQKVNKTESAVQLRFDARHCKGLSNAVYLRLKRIAGTRMTRDGVIVITANRFRTQDRNRQDAMDRLIELIQEAAHPPKYRRPTKPTKASNRRRLDSKKRQSSVKKGRGRVRDTD